MHIPNTDYIYGPVKDIHEDSLPIYVPAITGGSNSTIPPAGYNGYKIFENTFSLQNIGQGLLKGVFTSDDVVNYDITELASGITAKYIATGLSVLGIATMVADVILNSNTTCHLRGTYINEKGNSYVVIEFGIDIPNIINHAGSYFFLLYCNLDNMGTLNSVEEKQKELGILLEHV